ncbi:hypothetical protein ACFE04_008366 [Oxalis oulophora]
MFSVSSLLAASERASPTLSIYSVSPFQLGLHRRGLFGALVSGWVTSAHRRANRVHPVYSLVAVARPDTSHQEEEGRADRRRSTEKDGTHLVRGASDSLSFVIVGTPCGVGTSCSYTKAEGFRNGLRGFASDAGLAYTRRRKRKRQRHFSKAGLGAIPI